MKVRSFHPPIDQVVVSKHGFYKINNSYYTCALYFPIHVGTLWWFSLSPNSLIHTQVVWPCLLLHYVAQKVTVNLIYELVLDLIQNISHLPYMNQNS